MAMNGTYLDAITTHGKGLITHLGLVDAGGTEITGGSPAYARIATTWTGPTAGDGLIRPNADKVFNVPAGVTVGGWRGYSASSGGTGYGGQGLTNQAFATQGTYTLTAATTGIDHNAV